MSSETGSMSGDLLAALARFAHTFTWSDAPEVVQRQAKFSILDTVGCMVAGADTDEGQRLLAIEKGLSSRELSSVIGASGKLDIANAIRVNAYFGDIFELNDLTGGHASIAVVPAALAYAEAKGRSGRELVEAVIVGIEVVSRVYAAYYPSIKSFEDVGITPPGIPSTIGTAAALARLAQLSEAQTAHALQIAGSLAGWCPAEVIFGEGGTAKPMLFGSWPGSVALQAVVYAEGGLTGPRRLLESRVGLYSTLAHTYEPKVILESSQWYLERPRRKQHACCGYIHSAIDAVVKLRNQGVDVQQAATLEVQLPEYVLPVISKSGPPSTPNEARFHAEYCIAQAVAGVDVITPEHSMDLDKHFPPVCDAMGRIRIRSSEQLNHYHQCRVVGLDLQGATLFDTLLAAPKGAPGDPLSDDDVNRKFSQLVTRRSPKGGMANYVAQLEALETCADSSWIIRNFC